MAGKFNPRHGVKYVAEFRDGTLARRLAARLRAEAHAGRSYRFMEFCGGHTHALARHGVLDLLPDSVRMIHGPGCPVCVLPVGRIDMAMRLAGERSIALCTYGDVLRVPASAGQSLLQAKARGADVRMVISPTEALEHARREPRREVVFLAIGFETTTPATALAVEQAAREGLSNFSILCCHVLTPSAIEHLAALDGDGQAGPGSLDGFVGPAHVSVIIGSSAFEPFVKRHRKPVVIAGFEPLDLMQAILMLVRQVNGGRAEVENQYTRAVIAGGNAMAQAAMARVFELRERFEWRGLGELPASALRLRSEFGAFDAERRFALDCRPVPDHKQCECAAILRGHKRPADCRLFGVVCTPENPMGSCMVSSEGACAAHYTYGRFRDVPIRSASA